MEETQQEVASAATATILQPHFVRKVVAETIATYLLVFVTCGAGAISAVDERRVSRLAASVAGGLIVTVMIYAVGHISGAHMNPAVTLAFAAVRHFPWYQLTGAISAGFTVGILLGPIEHVGTTSPSGTHIQALVMEIVVTFSMMFITSAVATDTKAIGELAGIAVGSATDIGWIDEPGKESRTRPSEWILQGHMVTGALLGAWTYSLIRVSDKPVHAISPQQSLSFKLRRNKSSCVNDLEMTSSVANKDNDRHDCC
ncbi:hypothetical protein V2J09_017450 [Rumex salicifolius]